MTRITKSLIFAVLMILLATSACGGAASTPDQAGSVAGNELAGSGDNVDPGGKTPGPERDEPAAVTLSATEPDSVSLPAVPSEPNPASVDITLEESTAAKGTIGPDGGSLEAVDGNGTRYTLTVPEGALLSPVEITMTPIAGAEGEAIGDTFRAGVALQPEGLHFLKMVAIEITGDVVQEGAIGFSAEGGGQDFHLTPASHAGRSLVIPTSHFSIIGFSKEEIIAQFTQVVPANVDAQILNILSLAGDDDILDVLANWAGLVKGAGQIGTYEEWVTWTASYNSLLQWTFWLINDRGWDMNTPGLAGLLDELQAILDLWFKQTTAVVEALTEKCLDGELKEFIKISQIIEVGKSLAGYLGLEKEEEFKIWEDLANSCLNFTITWQANVVTRGTAPGLGDFFSDISVGSEGHSPQPGSSFVIMHELEVEYIDGFWHDKCVTQSGEVVLMLDIDWDTPNFGSSIGISLNSITAYVTITNPVFIDCTAAPIWAQYNADAQAPFHGAALDELNKERVEDGHWKFELVYNPGSGLVAQFEEGFEEPITLDFPSGKYEFSQLVSLYVYTPAD
jgi:hypothetical protein